MFNEKYLIFIYYKKLFFKLLIEISSEIQKILQNVVNG